MTPSAPAPEFQAPDLPPGAWKLALLLAAAFAARLIWSTGLLDPGRLRSPLRAHRLRRKAYRVADKTGLVQLVGDSDRHVRAAHERQTVKQLKRSGRHVTYALLRHREGLDLSRGSKDRAKFEAGWRQAMTRPDEHGNPSHDWEFQPYVGSSVIACRAVPLPHPDVVRLFEQLQPTFKWPEGTRPAEVIHARTD